MPTKVGFVGLGVMGAPIYRSGEHSSVLKDIDTPEEYQKYTKRAGPDES
jgi:3-hydroxyisobutyrate dehydrogenase-like beta-hydroxyacid dehydrogenase